MAISTHFSPRLSYSLTLHHIHLALRQSQKEKRSCALPLEQLPQKKAAKERVKPADDLTEGNDPLVSAQSFPQSHLGERLLAAAYKGDTAAAKLLYNSLSEEQHAEVTNYQDPNHGRTPLSVACERGSQSLVTLLMSKGADVYLYDADTMITPLMWAAGAGHANIVAILLAEGEADAFFPATSGRTAAMEAAKGGCTACLELLLELGGIDVRQANDYDGTHPMLECAAHGHLDALKVLLAAPGSRVNQTDKSGNTCLLFAARNGDVKMLSILLQAGAKNIPEFVNLRLPLHEAALYNHLAAVTTLIRAHGASITQERDRQMAAAIAARPPPPSTRLVEAQESSSSPDSPPLKAVDRAGKTAADLAGSPQVRAALKAVS